MSDHQYEITLFLSTDKDGAWVCTCSSPFGEGDENDHIAVHETAAGAIEEMAALLAESAFDHIEEL